jgi:terpene synthase-like protein
VSSQKLQSKYLAGLSGEEQKHIFTLSAALARPLGEWVARHSQLMRPVRTPQVCLTLAATAPFLDVAALLPAARMIFWVFAADDLADEGGMPTAELWPRLDRCLALLDNPGEASTGGDPLLEVLKELRDELARYPLFATLRPHLAEGLRAFLRGMHREHEWSAEYRDSPLHPVPSFAEYLENERRTTGSLLILMCVLTTMNDPSVPAHLPRLLEMERAISVSIRLANDVRGYEREVGEGKLNALTILQHELMKQEGLEAGAALDRARAKVKELIPNGLELCQTLGRKERTTSVNPERFITNLVAFTCDFYAHHDYHHTLVRPNE